MHWGTSILDDSTMLVATIYCWKTSTYFAAARFFLVAADVGRPDGGRERRSSSDGATDFGGPPGVPPGVVEGVPVGGVAVGGRAPLRGGKPDIGGMDDPGGPPDGVVVFAREAGGVGPAVCAGLAVCARPGGGGGGAAAAGAAF